MCIIIAKDKTGVFPNDQYIKNSFSNNPDGAGLMYTKDGVVVIEKGFMTIFSFMQRINELKMEHSNFDGKSFVMHFRIGTQGKNDEHTCHPFPISSKNKLLRKTNLTTDVGMVHNGIISHYSYGYKTKIANDDKALSDTQLFIKYCVNSFKSLNRNFYKNNLVMSFLDEFCGGKLCFLDSKDDLYLLGDYSEEDNVYYSNNTHRYDWSQPKYVTKPTEDTYFSDPSEEDASDKGIYNKWWLQAVPTGDYYDLRTGDIITREYPNGEVRVLEVKLNNYYVVDIEGALYMLDEDNVLEHVGYILNLTSVSYGAIDFAK